MKNWRVLVLIGSAGAVAAMVSGCFGPLAKRLADQETYPIIEEKQLEALGRRRDFTIEPDRSALAVRIESTAARAGDEFSTAGLTISLAEALSLAVLNSREYQSEKESLYLTALALTEARYEFSPIFSAAVAASVTRDPGSAEGSVSRAGSINLGQGGGAPLRMTKLFATGARLTFQLSNSLVRFGGGDPIEVATGAISADFVQPILRGAGSKVVLEGLKQAERNVIYAARDFARFEREFIVGRTISYLRLLQRIDTVRNQRASLASRTVSRDRSEALFEAGQTVGIVQLDQARQSQLSAENAVVRAEADYMRAIDSYKFSIGLPTELDVVPDQREMDELIEEGLPPIEIDLGVAVELALARRLDYMTTRQDVEDLERKLFIAENSLLPDLDLFASIGIPDEGQNQPLSFDGRRRNYEIGAELELPLDRKVERNAYRRALISLEARRRNSDRLRDAIVQEVRSTFQDLLEARLSYDIELSSVAVAERRVLSSQDLFEAGRADIRDIVDSQDDLVAAQNSLTRTLIDYIEARLSFLVAIEGLDVDDTGMWVEIHGEDQIADASQ